MALKFYDVFSALLPIAVCYALSLVAQSVVISFYRKKDAWEKGESMRKWGLGIMIAGVISAIVITALGGSKSQANSSIGAAIGGINLWISGKYMLEDNREKFAGTLKEIGRWLFLLSVILLGGFVISWAFTVAAN